MIKSYSNSFTFFEYINLSKQKNIVHFISSRKGGISKPPYEDTNMSFMVGDDFDCVTQNRKNFLKNFDISELNCVFAGLAHGINIKIIKKLPTIMNNGFSTVGNVDALITTLPNICLIVTAADCVPVTIYDQDKKVIAMAHAGWRGSTNGVVSKVIAKMKEDFGSKPKNILVGIGPSICANHYEVGPEVVSKLSEDFINTDVVEKISANKWKLDLVKLNIYQMTGQGIPNENIEISGYCTYENNDFFYSNRKNNPTGRFMSGIMLKNE